MPERSSKARRVPGLAHFLAAALLMVPFPGGGAAAGGPPAVSIRGEVGAPGRYPIAPGERLSSLIDRAGGLTDDAHPPGAVLTRLSERKRQAGDLGEVVGALLSLVSPDARYTDASPAGLAGPEAGPADARPPGPDAARHAFAAALRGLEPSGRIRIRVDHPRLLKGTADDVVLEDGDDLLIPPLVETVTVTGAVAAPGPHPHVPSAGYRDSIRAAGGPTGAGDTRRAWILRADGSADRLSRRFVAWNPALARWEIAGFQAGADRRIAPGDTIVVPRAAREAPWIADPERVDELLMRAAVLTGRIVLP